MAEDSRKEITSITRGQAKRFLAQYETIMSGELDGLLAAGSVPDAKFLELFAIEKAEIKPRFDDFMRALRELEKDGTPDASAIQDGLDIIAGMYRATSNAESLATSMDPDVRAHWTRTEIPPNATDNKKAELLRAQQQDRHDFEIEKLKVGAAALALIEVAKGVGIDAQPYVDGLGLRELQ